MRREKKINKREKGRRGGGGGVREESGIHNNPPQTGAVCVCARTCMCTCSLMNLYLLSSEAHVIFGNGIKHTTTKKKSMKNAYSLFPLVFLSSGSSVPRGLLLLAALQRRRRRRRRSGS